MQPENAPRSNEITSLKIPKRPEPPLAVLPDGTKRLEFEAIKNSQIIAIVVDGELFLGEVVKRRDDRIEVKFADNSYRAFLPHWPSFRGARSVTQEERKLWDQRPKLIRDN